MRENKKVLKFKKLKIANLQASSIIGGTDSNPCNETLPSEAITTDQDTCRTSERHYPSDCTRGRFLTDEDVANCRG